MAYLTLQTQTIGDWQFGGSTAYLYIWASQPFYEATTGEYIARGQVNNLTSFYQKITCTVSGTTLTIPEVVLATTTDSTVPNATYTATLATSANRFVYPLLQDFFVDPEYLASSTQASVEFASAGTAAINGLYTYRGQTGGYNYYNLQGQSTSTTLFVVKNDGSQWVVTSSAGTIMYTTATQEDLPWDGGWIIASGVANAPNVSENADYISGTWEQLTLSNQGVSAIPPQWPGPFWNVPQVKEYVNGLVGTGTTPFASRTVIGKTALDENPVLSTDPMAVAINSNRILRVLVEDYANNLATAVTDIGATPTTLVIKEDATVSTAVTIPATLFLEFQQGAVLTKSLSGALEFEGFGITDPTSQIPIFSNFATGGIQWTGTDAPVAISTELWDTASTSLTARLDRANAAFPSKTVQIICYPRTITGTTTFSENRSVHFTIGNYPTSITTNIYPFVFDSNFSATADAGAIINLSYLGSSGGAGFTPASLNTPIENIFFDGLHFLGDLAGTPNGANSVIISGAAATGYIRNCVMENLYQFTVIGSDGTLGNYPSNFDISNCKFINCATQAVAVLNGNNVQVMNNYFDVRGITQSSNNVQIDIEPNADYDNIDGLTISNNVLDLRSTGVLYQNGIAIQGGASNVYNVTVSNNTLIGDSSVGAALSGINITSVDGVRASNNTVFELNQRGMQVTNCNNVLVDNNDLHNCGDATFSTYAILLYGCRDAQVKDNTLVRGIGLGLGRGTGIYEAESLYPATSAASTITLVTPGRTKPFWIGLTVLFNGTSYTVATHPDYDEITTTVPVGTIIVETAASATDINTGTDTITFGAHNLINGCLLRYTAGSVAVGGLTDGSDYYVVGATATTVQVALTLGGSAIDLTSTGTGTQTFTPILQTRFANNTYKNNDASLVTLASTGTSRLLGDYIRTITDTLAFSISANTDNYAPSQNVVRYDITTDASRNLTGLAFTAPAQVNGEHHTFYNAGAQNLVVVHNATSTAANRFWCNTLADITVLPGQRVDLEYNSTIARWMVAAYGVIITAASLPTGIDAAKIADGSVSNAEFQYLNGVSSAIQTQMDLKAPLISPSFTGTVITPILTATTSIAIGAGTPITKVVRGSVTINPTNIAANTVATQTFTLTGAVTGDSLILNAPTAGVDAGILICQSWVSAADTISVTFNNTTGGGIDIASATWFYTLIRS